MEERCLTNDCSFAGVKPVMADLPYPEIRVRRRNRDYADLLSVDYCGFVSELSAITQYINNETRICGERCSLARTLLGIAVAEMMHLQKLGELIVLLGGDIDFTAKTRNGCSKLWTPEYLSISENIDKMLEDDIEAEKEAICQYEMHIKMINDDCVNSVLKRIILDEEYHIMLLKVLKNER
ncbi:rubrerythrin family protein [Parablautia intestinalis]|jgi:bacterioferritin|uniref:Rubrerythrin family protein n=1 Tax=Parablautia intestinalis TaxID=2320100 RepID=A0A3A9A8V0_9FIRM|nr:ferritin family protein [Parablautia intestinalis]MCI8615589.1 rubrerythrin family protein [Lachnospiraceae bacterium]RKI88072.1 rubrerythrin family protein [Parablautia intestinalis]